MNLRSVAGSMSGREYLIEIHRSRYIQLVRILNNVGTKTHCFFDDSGSTDDSASSGRVSGRR